jgi:hypothetical protein
MFLFGVHIVSTQGPKPHKLRQIGINKKALQVLVY